MDAVFANTAEIIVADESGVTATATSTAYFEVGDVLPTVKLEKLVNTWRCPNRVATSTTRSGSPTRARNR